MAPWQLLEVKEEEELHKARLLNVEEKPFKRITKRVQSLHGLAKSDKHASSDSSQRQNGVAGGKPATSSRPSTPTTAPAVGESVLDNGDTGVDMEQLAQMREELTLDFAAFDSTIGRLQFLMTANAAERARYTADRQAILDTCQEVRDNNVTLRVTLEEAKVALERRRKLDDLADKITSNRMLKPRADQLANLAKLEEECAQLEEESETYAVTWRERRDQFARIMDESMRLRRQIRDEKEEVDRREGMGEEDNEDRGGDDAPTPRPGVASGNATPMPGHHAGGGGIGSSSLASKMMLANGMDSQDTTGSGASRPASTTGGRTPARDSPGPSQEMLLKPRPDASAGGFGSSSQTGSVMGSRPVSRDGSGGAAATGTTPAAATTTIGDDGPEEGEDVEMDDTAEAMSASRGGATVASSAEDTPMNDTQTTTDNTPRITVDGQDVVEDRMDTT